MANLSSIWVENYKDVNEDQAQAEIIKCHQKIKEIKELQVADTKLREAQELVKDLRGAYTSAKNAEKAKIEFFLDKINEIQAGTVNPTSGANP